MGLERLQYRFPISRKAGDSLRRILRSEVSRMCRGNQSFFPVSRRLTVPRLEALLYRLEYASERQRAKVLTLRREEASTLSACINAVIAAADSGVLTGYTPSLRSAGRRAEILATS